MEQFIHSRTVADLKKIKNGLNIKTNIGILKNDIANNLILYVNDNNITMEDITNVLTKKENPTTQTNKDKILTTLGSLPRDELRKHYKELGLKGGLSSMSKDDLVKSIMENLPDINGLYINTHQRLKNTVNNLLNDRIDIELLQYIIIHCFSDIETFVVEVNKLKQKEMSTDEIIKIIQESTAEQK